jgi:hypothetical protein
MIIKMLLPATLIMLYSIVGLPDFVSINIETTNSETKIEVPPPPLSEDIFPCSTCHSDLEPNPARRELLDAHTEIVLKHDEQHRWCLDCHSMRDRDKLQLANGNLLDFKESYLLCGQCHGPQLRDWKAGIHGKRTGSWNGAKRYLLCVHCHNAHSPGFQKMKPESPPLHPEEIKVKNK